jgi:hypothetical protein
MPIQASWSSAYFDEGGANQPIITYSVPIRQDGVFIGVVTMDVGLDPSSTLGMGQEPAFEEAPDGKAGGWAQGRLCGISLQGLRFAVCG